MSIEIESDILAKELNQGIVPLGVPKAYQYDAALVEAARAAVNQGLDNVAGAATVAESEVSSARTAAVSSVQSQETTSTANINNLGDKILAQIKIGDKILAQIKNGYGYPFTAATAAAMTDVTKIYVYTGSETGYAAGNWYYNNGTAWYSGGIYNATAFETDTNLSAAKMAADAKAVGDRLLNDESLIYCNYISSIEHVKDVSNTTLNVEKHNIHFFKIDKNTANTSVSEYWTISFKHAIKKLLFKPYLSSAVKTFELRIYNTATGKPVVNNDVPILISSTTYNNGDTISIENIPTSYFLGIAPTVKNDTTMAVKYVEKFSDAYLCSSGYVEFTGNSFNIIQEKPNLKIAGEYTIELFESIHDKYSDLEDQVRFYSNSYRKNYIYPEYSNLDQNTVWCMYFDKTVFRPKITPHWFFIDNNTSGTYIWQHYRTVDGNAVSDASYLKLIDQGSANIGESVTFDIVDNADLIYINSQEAKLEYSNNTVYPHTHLCEINTVYENTAVKSNSATKFYGNTFCVDLTIDEKCKLSKLNGKRWLAFGDSLTEENFRAKYHYHDYIANEYGMTIINYGSSGKGYKNSYWDSGAFYQRMENINPDDFDFLTIFGSGNDYNYNTKELMGELSYTNRDISTLWGCVNKTIEVFYLKAPNKSIGIVTPTPWASYPTYEVDNWMDKYSNGLVQIAKWWGIPVLDLYHCSGLRPWDADFRSVYYISETGVLDNDGAHPNSLGNEIFLKPKFEEFIKNLI